MTTAPASLPPSDASAVAPRRAGLVLASLIVGAIVCNVNLSVANIALPDIARSLDASQTMVNLVAIGTTLGLAMSVLWFGALGDRHGRKGMLLLGLFLTVPFSLAATFAPTVEVLVLARLATGLAAGMAYPTTLALITALWGDGPGRTRSIALWSGLSAASAAIGPVIAGLLLSEFWWGSVFLIAVPPAVVGFVMVARTVPAHVNESSDRVDQVGGGLSAFMVATLVIGISFIGTPGRFWGSLAVLGVAVVSAGLFVVNQRRSANPLYDLSVASRRLFWVPAVGGMLVFGSLMGSMFVGQQFLQNVFGYSTVAAGFAIVPSAVGLVLSAPVSARLVLVSGSRITMVVGYAFTAAGFLVMLVTWREGVTYLWVGLAYFLIGTGAGLALTPASRSVTAATPVRRVGMASGTADLQRDLGGSIMQALLGALLTAGYAVAVNAQLADAPASATSQLTDDTRNLLTSSYASATEVATQFPQYASAIVDGARDSFQSGALLAIAAGLVTTVVGAAVVWFGYPSRRGEDELFADYAKADAAPTG